MSSRRRLLTLAVGLVVLAGVLGVTLPRLVGRGAASAVEEADAPQDRPGPVLLVPGYGGGTTGLAQLADRLRAAGREAVLVPAVDGGTADLHAQSSALDRAVERALDHGAPSVDIVGYSAGGVVARLWAVEHDGAHKARRIVTLGSPHHGTELASSAAAVLPTSCPTACQQLRLDSSLLASLNGRDETPAGPVWTSVWTTADTVVTPPESARLDGAVNVALQSVCAGERLEHGQLPTDPLSVGIVVQALGPGLDAPPPASECPTLRALGRT